MYDIIVLVLSSENPDYLKIEEEGIRETWVKNPPNNMKVIFYYGCDDCEEPKLVGDKLYLPVEDVYDNILLKTLKAFQFIKSNYDFKYLFRTNTSSYVDLDLLNKYIINKPLVNFYNGIIGNFKNVLFSSGSGFFLSYDVLELIINNEDKIDYSLIDDVAVGKLLSSLNVKIHGHAKRFDITNDNSRIPSNHYHYRVKHLGGNRKIDIVRMKKIDKIKKK